MKFTGQYSLKSENKKLIFPWIIPEDENLVWIITESIENTYTSVNCQITNIDVFEEQFSEEVQKIENFRIISQGNISLEPDNIWTLPESILDFLKSEEIVFCGAGFFAELMSPKTMEQYSDITDELNNLLNLI